MKGLTPAQAWQVIKEGNARFVAGESIHPSQGISDRERLVGGQAPHVVLFGCGDSRVAAEVIFDQGLGDMFVVRTAGHVIDEAVLGSIEFGTEVLDVPLIVVLGHDSCGAVGATLRAVDDLELPPGYIRSIVERVIPSVLSGRAQGLTRVDEFEAYHVAETGRLLTERSQVIADRIADGRLAIVGLNYHLNDGKISRSNVIGDIGE
ncbi:MAG: carbonic anhydrase [Gordonia sp. (in: high G+C Gram-positive bacteria)]